MSKARQIRCYDYVNHPYERVRDELSGDAVALFRAATKAATSRADSVAAQLRVSVGAFEVATDVAITVSEIEERSAGAMSAPTTRLKLEWEAAKSPRLFPIMRAELSVYPLTATETQLDFLGHYEPPLGPAGKAVNVVLGHRIAEASVHRFLVDVAKHLRTVLSEDPGPTEDPGP